MLTCQQCRTEIDAAARPERLTARAAEHLSACAACRTFQAERQQLRRLISELEPVGAPPDFEFRLSARMAARPHATPFFNLSLLTPRAVSLVMAASLVLAFAVMLRWRAQQSATGGESTTNQSTALVAIPTDTPKEEGKSQTNSAGTTNAIGANNGAGDSVPAKAQRHLPKIERGELARTNASKTTIAPVEARDSSLLGTSGLTANNVSPDVAPAAIPVSVPTSNKPLQVLFKDTQGATRVISIEPVSFGSRALLGGRAQVTQAKLTADQGVW